MDKKLKSIADKMRVHIKNIQKYPNRMSVNNYNSVVLGIKNYYKGATHCNIDFKKLAFRLSRTLYNRLKRIGKYGIPKKPSETYTKLHKNNFKTFEIDKAHLFPIADIQTENLMNFSQDTCNYTVKGREKITKILEGSIKAQINKMMITSDFSNLEYTYNH
ncbi:hypothetical protein ACQKIW_29260 [Bacillus thuringiensis]|uniref:hypothetical protein n=1 Tax=Bacillus thuringiensis TaxID=1428 RepID=UPI003D018803